MQRLKKLFVLAKENAGARLEREKNGIGGKMGGRSEKEMSDEILALLAQHGDMLNSQSMNSEQVTFNNSLAFSPHFYSSNICERLSFLLLLMLLSLVLLALTANTNSPFPLKSCMLVAILLISLSV